MRILAITTVCMLSALPAFGVRNLSDELTKMEVSENIGSFINEVKTFGYTLSTAQPGQLNTMRRHATIMDTRWNDFYSKSVDIISQDEKLLGMAADYEQLWLTALDSLNLCITRIEKASVFRKDEQFVQSKIAVYKKLESDAVKLSMVKQTAQQLEKLKAEEQLEFAKIESAFQEAEEAAEINPALSGRMAELRETFIKIQLSSTAIRQAEFKPFIERIKDYLMSLAAVSIIAMFAIFLSNYVKTAKKAREAQQKMKEALGDNNSITPSI